MEDIEDDADPEVVELVRGMVDEDLMGAYWRATKDLNSRDLVLFLDIASETLHVDVRENILQLAEHPDAPYDLLDYMKEPAIQVVDPTPGTLSAFWFVVELPDEQMVCLAVNATYMQRGGEA